MPRGNSYTYETTISFGGDTPTAELDVRFSFTVSWGTPETPPCYAHGGLPADPDEVDDIRVVAVNGLPSGWSDHQSDAGVADTLINALTEDDYARMLEEAIEADASDYEAYQEMLADERRMEARHG